MKICIYDLSSSYEVRVIDSDSKSTLLTYKLPPALIREDSCHANSKCSLFDPDAPDFSAFIKIKEGNVLRYAYDNDKLFTLTEIMYSLCWETNSDLSLIESYFKAIKNVTVQSCLL